MTQKSKSSESSAVVKSDTAIAESKLKECFIITPIGANGSEIFLKTEGLIRSVLAPVLAEFGYRPLPAHHIDTSGSINKQIIELIVNCKLVIANLTGVNPNVMYELAIRHSFGKKVITMAENGTKLPFDIVDQRTLFYDDSMKGVDEIKPALRKAIESCLNDDDDQKVSNPVFDAVKEYTQIQNLPQDKKDIFEMLLNRLDNMESQISFNNRQNRRYPITAGRAVSVNGTTTETINYRISVTTGAENTVRDKVSRLLGDCPYNFTIIDPPNIKIAENSSKTFILFSLYGLTEEESKTLSERLQELNGVTGIVYTL